MTVSRTVRCTAGSLVLAVSMLFATEGVASESLGPVVLTHAHGDATAVWDATADLTAVVAGKPTAEEALRRLKADAVTVLAEKGKVLSGDAKTLTIQAIYQRTGAVSPSYQTATFLGVEHLFTLKAEVVKATENAVTWSKQLKAGATPDGVTVTVTGKLPPELK